MVYIYNYNLVGGLEHVLFCPFHIWDVILPIDELHHFSRWLKPPLLEMMNDGNG
jgi:hypothetical protein